MAGADRSVVRLQQLLAKLLNFVVSFDRATVSTYFVA